MNTDRLLTEARHAANSARSGITNRRDHPSFGYTKASIAAHLARATSLMEAHMIVAGAWDKPGTPLSIAIDAYAARFDIDLPRLRQDLKGA